jgi:hypothetical protein
MDIDGGMDTDIYDSMAAAVSSAYCIIIFMSDRYLESANCQLEAKFARTMGCPIVPVNLEGGNWRATEWLGLVRLLYFLRSTV